MNYSFWDTYFYITKLKEAENIFKEWEPFLSDDKYVSDSDWSMAQTKSSIRNNKNKDLPWKVWFDAIQPQMNTYLESLDPQMPYSVHCDEMWFNKYTKGDYQEPHDHAFPGRGVSAIYVLDYPQDEKDPGGHLVFECPNFPVVRSSGLDRIFNAWNYQHITPPLEKGTLIFFPSWISHYVLPSKTDKRRATIAANFVVRGVPKDE